MFSRIAALPIWAKVALGLIALLVSILLSPLMILVALLVLVIAVLALIYKAVRRRSLKRWGFVALASLLLIFVFQGISSALYPSLQRDRASTPIETVEEASKEETPTEDAEETETTEEEAAKEEDADDTSSTSAASDADEEGSDSGRFDAVVTVTRVVDGDTVEVSPAIDGIEDVRLIGVDTPEVNDPNCDGEQPYGREASDFTQDQLEGQKIELEFDKDKTDKYDRLLAYVYPKGEEMFNKKLLEEGYAQVRTFRPNTKYESQFKEAEREAKQAERGIWSLSRLEVIELMDKADTPGGDGCSPKAIPKAQQQPSQQQPSQQQPSQQQPQFDAPPPPAGGGGKTCSDFSTRTEAKQALPANPQLDRNKDGVPCESLPP